MTVTPGTWNYTIYQGATFDETLTISGLNLSGFDARSQIRSNYADDGSAALTMDTDANGGMTLTVVDSNTATLQITISATTTADIDAGTYKHDIELYNSTTGEVIRLLQGKVTVSPEATRV